MIHIAEQPEPAQFDAKVRQPGLRFLQNTPSPHGREWNSHSYWTRTSHDLHQKYGGICAYSCHWIPYDTGWQTTEHFKPKDLYPEDAYEWNNYRLVCGILNGRKGVTVNILDPFSIEDGWFIISFPSLIVQPSDQLSAKLQEDVNNTIITLGLNDKGTCHKSRLRYLMGYCENKYPFEHLEAESPFLASELRRQGLIATIASIMLS